MRNTGVFFVPMRFMRIFTDINISKEHENYRSQAGFASLVFGKLVACGGRQSLV
jgi:hypothetical protein